MKKLTVLLVFMLFLHPSFACLILVLTNGSSVLVGNHEDWYAKDAQVVFVPSTKEAYGYVGVGFASEPFIQGGMNSEGLFFDGTATPFYLLIFLISLPIKASYGRQSWKTVPQ